jgi:hypothetical protein
MIEASCHCGAIRLQVATRPERLTSCNCSLCRRYGTLWAYYRPDQVTFAAGAGRSVPYIQGDKTLAVHHCPTCGCVTHWEGLIEGRKEERMAVNARLMQPEDIANIPVRHFDGASTWTYLD